MREPLRVSRQRGECHMDSLLTSVLISLLLISPVAGARQRTSSESRGKADGLIQQGDVQELRRLLESEPALAKSTDIVGWTLLHQGVFTSGANAVEMCRMLIQRGVDIHAKDEGNTALHNSVFREERPGTRQCAEGHLSGVDCALARRPR